MMAGFWAATHRDLLLVLRRKHEALGALFFFVMVASLFPLGIGPESALLKKIAPGVIWVVALLAMMLGIPRLFTSDYEDGTLEQMVIAPGSLSLLIAGKMLAHWLVCGLPLVIIAPVIGLQFDLSASAIGVIAMSLLLGTPTLSMLGAVGAALTLGVRGSGLLLGLLVLPLYIPVLIFGASAVTAHIGGLGMEGHLSLLAALLILTAIVAPWVCAISVKVALE